MRTLLAKLVRRDKRQQVERGWIVKLAVELFPLRRRTRADAPDQSRNGFIIRVAQSLALIPGLYIRDREVERQKGRQKIAIGRLPPGEIERNSNGVIPEDCRKQAGRLRLCPRERYPVGWAAAGAETG